MRIENLTLKEFFARPRADYDVILDTLNAVNSFAGHSMDINSMPYTNVKYCLRLLTKAPDKDEVAKLFEICFGVKTTAFWSAGIVEYYQAKKFMLTAFEKVMLAEERMFYSLSAEQHLWKMAGADRLKPFQDTLPLIQLGKAFGQYPFDIGRKPYSEVVNLLYAIKVQGDVETEFMKLKK